MVDDEGTFIDGRAPWPPVGNCAQIQGMTGVGALSDEHDGLIRLQRLFVLILLHNLLLATAGQSCPTSTPVLPRFLPVFSRALGFPCLGIVP